MVKWVEFDMWAFYLKRISLSNGLEHAFGCEDAAAGDEVFDVFLQSAGLYPGVRTDIILIYRQR